MSTSETPESNRPTMALTAFSVWAWGMLGWRTEYRSDGSLQVFLPESLHSEYGESVIVKDWNALPDDIPRITEFRNSPLFAATRQEIRNHGNVMHAAPVGQPTSVHQLAPKLFDHYTVEGGRVQLGGCSLEDHPLLRQTYLIRSAESIPHVIHVFRTTDGRSVEPTLLESLHVHDLNAVERPPRLAPGELSGWLSNGASSPPAICENEQVELILTTVVWCKYLQCKLTFEIGDAHAELPFGSWAQWLANDTTSPPPFRCKWTERESYRIVRTDDGRLTVPKSVAVCEHSGRRVLETELHTCEISGLCVVDEYLRICPITGQRVIVTLMVTCNACAQDVSPKAATGGRCQACRSVRSIHKEDPRMARIFDEYPKLEHWSRWKLSETNSAYILNGASFLRRLLVVIDKETLEPLRIADRSFLSRRWSPISESQWKEYLR